MTEPASDRSENAHDLARDDVELGVLGEEIAAKMGRPVALTSAELDDGTRYLILSDPGTGEELADVDPAMVQSSIKSHKPPPSAEELRAQAIASAKKKASSGDTAGALADVIALLGNETSPPQAQTTRP